MKSTKTIPYGKIFLPNHTKKNILILYLFFGFFMALGLFFIILGFFTDVKQDSQTMGGIIFGFSLFLFLCSHFLTTPSKVSYIVGKDEVILRAGKKELIIPFLEIKSIVLLKEKQAENFILKLSQITEIKQNERITEAIFAPKQINFFSIIKNVFKEQTYSYAPYKFLSVPVAYIKKGAGNSIGIQKTTSVDLPCDTVFILLINGEGYFISPLDIDGFASEVKKCIPLVSEDSISLKNK